MTDAFCHFKRLLLLGLFVHEFIFTISMETRRRSV